MADVGRSPALARPGRARAHLPADRPRHHRWLPSPAHPPQLQDEPRAARAAGRAGLGGRRGPGDRVGRQPPQAPSVLRRAGRSAQPARRSRERLARGAGRAVPRARRLDPRRRRAGQRGALRQGPARRPGRALRRPHVRAVGGARARLPVRARLRAHGLDRRGPDGAAVGRRGAHVPAAPRDLLDQLAVPLLRAAQLRHGRSVAQPRVAGAAHARRGMAQQPPRLPDLRAPRAALVAARPVGVADRRPRARGPRVGRRADRARAPAREERPGA